MNGGIPIEKIKSIMRKYLEKIEDIEIEVYEFDTSSTDPLFENLKSAIDMNINVLSEKSKIKVRYWDKIISLVKNNEVNSIFELCNYRLGEKRVIGKTNIERLYCYLSENKNINVHTQSQLKIPIIGNLD